MAANTTPLGFEFDARFDKLFKAMTVMESRLTAATNKFNTKFQKSNKVVVDGLSKQATGFARLGQVTGAQRFVIQNTANQFGDMAVQIGAGTSVMRTMSLQLPQLFGGFAALGGTLGTLGPLLGTVAAIGLPLAAVFFNMAAGSEEAADNAKTLEDRIGLLASATRDYAEAAELASAGTEDLADKYGAAAKEAQRALDIQRELRRSYAESALTGISGEIGNKFGGLVLQNNDVGDATEYEKTLKRIREELKLSAGEAVLVARALTAAMNAEGAAAQVAALQSLQNVLVDIYGSIAKADEATGGLVLGINDAVIAGAELLKTSQDIAEQSSILVGILESGAGYLDIMGQSAATLAGNISAAAKNAWDYAGAVGAAAKAANQQLAFSAIEFSPGGQALAKYGSRTPGGTASQNALATRYKPKALGGGGGGGSNINKDEAADLAKVRSLYDSTRTAAEQYAIKVAELNRLRKEGKIDNDLYARSLADLDKEFASSNIDGFKSSILDIATGVTSAADAFDALKDAIKRAAVEFLFFGSGPFSGGGGIGSIVSGILGSAFGGLPNFAGGGSTGSGVRAGGLDGKGGYMAMVHPRETIIDHTKGGSSAGSMDVRVFVDEGGNWRAAVERISSGVSAQVVKANNYQLHQMRRRQ